MGGSNTSSGYKVRTERYAPYVESQHSNLLNLTATHRDAIINSSPFADYDHADVDYAFFGVGYIISSFPSLYDMFGKYMSGLDIETLWNSAFSNIVDTSEIDKNVAEEMKLVDDEMADGELADFQVSMRDLNAVSTSSFIIGMAVEENIRTKTFAKMSLDAKAALFDRSEKDYEKHLNWDKGDITVYAKIMKDYFMWKVGMDSVDYTFDSRDSLWPFTVLSFEGIALGTMRGTTSWEKKMTVRERSTVSKALLVSSYTVTGAYLGSSIMPGWGTVIGGVIGFVVGIAMLFLE